MVSILTLTLNPTVDVTIEVEELVPDRKLRSPYARYDPGGGGINVARGVRRCGGDARAVFTAGGPIGQMLAGLLADEQVLGRTVPIAHTTREGLAVWVTGRDELYRFNLPGPALSSAEAEACLQAMTEQRPLPRYWVASGSLPPGVEPDFYARLARCAREHGARLILDTSGPALKQAAAEGVYLLKPNHNELDELVGEPVTDEAGWAEHSRALVARGAAQILVLSLGSAGALLTTADTQIRARPPRVEPLSPVGAGDSFVAMLTLQLAQGAPLRQALCYAVATGSAAVITPGTELFRPEDVERLYQQMGQEHACSVLY